MSDEQEPFSRPDGHRYEAPEPDATRHDKEWAYAALGIVVVIILILVATGRVQVFGG